MDAVPGAVRAQVQLMMRKQGSLYLASLVCASLSDSLSERAAASRLTLALRHYDRALNLRGGLGQGSAAVASANAVASPAMERCVAECRLELATFFLSWSQSTSVRALGTEAGATRIRHLEAALGHARAGASTATPHAPATPHASATPHHAPATSATAPHVPATLPTATLPAEVVRALSQAEHTALRELIKAHTAHGNVARASALKEVYRRQLGALKTAFLQAEGPG